MKDHTTKEKQNLDNTAIELETIFNSTQDAMFLVEVVDGEFRYLRNNLSHQRLTGFSLEDIRNKTPVELVGKEIGEKIKANYRKCLETRSPIIYEETLLLPGGERTWLTSLTPVIENGTVRYIVGASKDITEQAKIAREKEEILNRLQNMFEGHSAVMLLIDPQSGKIMDANPAACDFYGYGKDELLTMNIKELSQLSEEKIKELQDVLVQGKTKYFITSHRLKNGETRKVDVYTCPIDYGKNKMLFYIIFDVTDRENYREELEKKEEMLKTTLASIGNGVAAFDNTGSLISLNRAGEEITGWKQEEALNKSFTDIFKFLDRETGLPIEDFSEQVLQEGKTVTSSDSTWLLTKNGTKLNIQHTTTPIKDEKGQTLGMVIAFRDITREKEQENQIAYLSCFDPLTGLYNRHFMEEKIKELEKETAYPLGIIIADVNGLKLINDVFGHEEGNRMLVKAADILKNTCPQISFIGRWGGDEFLVLLPGIEEKDLEDIVQAIKREVASLRCEKNHLSMSLGYTLRRYSRNNMLELIKEAEERMYRQKMNESSSYRNAIINTLLSTLHAKNMETEEHAERLKGLCLNIAEEMGLSDREIDELSLLAVLHDIGKIGIREDILLKPGSLNDKEWAEMKKHSEIGWRIAKNTPELAGVAEYILHHHERWDGKGYPKGLKGDEIPLVCRILAVADAYDAMTSDRPYRKALSKEKALTEIIKNAGTQFDPEVVRVFRKVFYKHKLDAS